jgi:uncharacterized protein YraI
MKKFLTRAAATATALAVSTVALASGESGTASVTEMDVGPGTFFALLGGVVGMGVVIWLMLKLFNRKK